MMRLFRLFLLVWVGLTAVSCSSISNNTLPTQVPVAIVPAGPAGTNALNAPFQLQEAQAAGLQIEHPQDWDSQANDDGIHLTPKPTNAPNAEPLLSTAVSIINLSDIDPNTSIVAALETVITNPNLGAPESIIRIAAPTAVTINNYTAAAAQIQVIPPDLTPIEGNPDLEGNAPLNTPANLHLYIVALRYEDRTVLFSGTTSTDTADIYMPIFETILNTVQITEQTAAE